MTPEGGVLMSPEPTNGFRKVTDLNGDGVDELLIAKSETGAEFLWSGDPESRLDVPMDILITLKFRFSGQVAVTSRETGEFLFLPGGLYSVPRDTVYHLQATEDEVSVLSEEPVGFIPDGVIANPDHPTPQPLFVHRHDQPITLFMGDTSMLITDDLGEGYMGSPTRFDQFDGVAGYDLIELSTVQQAWMSTEDSGWRRAYVPTLTTSDGDHNPGLYSRDIDADGKTDFINGGSGEGDTYFQRIWWNITE